ncbi:MAG TPA: hypothetical protein VMB25_02905 [Bryobacteraceae bacterium]|nr:hypothetical protein [Bryobacteraceae bacterium]
MTPETKSSASAKGRLSTAVRTQQLYPWRRAPDLKYHLYWAPVSGFPARKDEREWMLRFFDAFNEIAKTQFQLQPEVFVQMSAVSKNRDAFIRNARTFRPRAGVSRRPGETALMPDPEKLEREAASAAKPGFDPLSLVPNQCLWLSAKAEHEARHLFQTGGGLSLFYRKAPPAPKPVPFQIPQQILDKYAELKKFDLESLYNLALGSDEFGKQAKTVFGAGLENELGFDVLPFIVPRMDAAAFFAMGADDIKNFFSVIEICVQESPTDDGFLLATGADMEKPLARTVTLLRQQGLIYPEQGT